MAFEVTQTHLIQLFKSISAKTMAPGTVRKNFKMLNCTDDTRK